MEIVVKTKQARLHESRRHKKTNKLLLTGLNLGRVFIPVARMAIHLSCRGAIPTILGLKTRPRQLLGYLLLAYTLPRKALVLLIVQPYPN